MARSGDRHPERGRLEAFMRGADLPAPEVREMVRHLLTGCPRCVGVTGRLWSLGELPRALRVLLEEGLAPPEPAGGAASGAPSRRKEEP
jgi:hypothetical protein